MSPDVSVVMSVYNGGPFLGQAIESILGQSHSDFEFIVIDDGSSDDSADTIASYRDARLRVVRHTENAGLASRLNEGFALATGRYIARMDADDVSLPDRLARQIKFMKADAYVGACGTWVDVAGDGVSQRWEYPTSHKAIHARLLFDCAMAHPTVMFDRIRLQKARLSYDSSYPCAQDYDLLVPGGGGPVASQPARGAVGPATARRPGRQAGCERPAAVGRSDQKAAVGAARYQTDGRAGGGSRGHQYVVLAADGIVPGRRRNLVVPASAVQPDPCLLS